MKVAEKTKKAFVISPIGQKGSDARKHADMVYNSVLLPAFSNSPYSLLRADGISKPSIITNDIVSAILGSDICVADLTGLNPNVFYELGIAHTAKRPTIHLASTSTTLPFDNIGYRAIIFDPFDWDSQEEARKLLRASLDEIGSDAFKVVNPVTAAQVEIAIGLSGDPQSQAMEDLMRRVASLESRGAAAPRLSLSKDFSRDRAFKVARTFGDPEWIPFLVSLVETADGDGRVPSSATLELLADKYAIKERPWPAGLGSAIHRMRLSPAESIIRMLGVLLNTAPEQMDV